jgi:hypothetical protein
MLGTIAASRGEANRDTRHRERRPEQKTLKRQVLTWYLEQNLFIDEG